MIDNNSLTSDAATDQRNDNLPLTRRGALSLLAGSAVAGVANGGAATSSSTKTWQKDRDARGHDLLDAGTVEASSVTMEELDSDTLGPLDSLGIHDAALGHVHTGAREADRVVWEDESGNFHADGPDGQVASGDDLLTVVQAAVDSLTTGRTRKEKVLVVASGSVPLDTSRRRAIDLPSYTVLDVPGRIHVEYPDEGNSDDVVVRSEDASHVTIPRLNVTGGPWMAVRLKSCSNVELGHVNVLCAPDSNTNDAIRIDDSGDGNRSSDVRLRSAYVEHSGHHAVETYGINRCQIGQVLAKDHGGVAVLLNETRDATVDSVLGHNPQTPPSYATFRCANHCENVTVDQVVSRGAPRGVHLITNSDDVTVGNVDVFGARDHGIKIDRTVDNVSIQGGRVENTAPTGVLVQGGSVSISDLRVVDDRPEHERTQEYGIHVTHTARHCQVVNNDVRRAGTEADIRVDPPADDARPSTAVRDNVGDGILSGTVIFQSGASPAARVAGVTDRKDVTLDLRASAIRGPADGEPFAWDGYFEWNGDTDRWDLVFEWRTDPLENVEVEYVVDQPLANLGRVSGEIDTV